MQVGSLFPTDEGWWQDIGWNGFWTTLDIEEVPIRYKELPPLECALFNVAFPWVPSMVNVCSVLKRFASQSAQIAQIVSIMEVSPFSPYLRPSKLDSSTTFQDLLKSTQNIQSALLNLLEVAEKLKPRKLRDRFSSLLGQKSREQHIIDHVLEILKDYSKFEEEIRRLSTLDFEDDNM